MNIFVAKLSPSTTGEDLQELFQEFGEVISTKVIIDKQTGNSKRYGFVEMKNDDEASQAISALNEKEFDNSQIVVKEANPRSESKPRKNNFSRGGGRGKDFNRNKGFN